MAVEFYAKITREIPWVALRERSCNILSELLSCATNEPCLEVVNRDPNTLTIGFASLTFQVRANDDSNVQLSVDWIPEDPTEPFDTGWSANLAMWRTDESFLLGMIVAAALSQLMATPVIDDSGLLNGPRLRTPLEVRALMCPAASLRESAQLIRAALGLSIDKP